MRIFSEFKEFAMRGNVIDMAVGVVIGGAFGRVVSSMVADILNPIVGVFTTGVSLSDRTITLLRGSDGQPSLVLAWGNFVQQVMDFVIIAFCLFLIIKVANTAKKRFERQQVQAAVEPTAEIRLLTEIRDALRKA